MDDLYQNAWSETTDTIAPFSKNESKPSWSSTKPTSSFDEEADLAAPSWSTGTGIHWDEPTGSPGFSWSHEETDAGWGPIIYEGISLGKPSVENEQSADPSPDMLPHESKVDILVPPSPGSSTPALPSSPPLAPCPSPPPPITDSVLAQNFEASAEVVAPPSPDGFGSFESGLAEDTVHSPVYTVNDVESDPWGSSAWVDTQAQDREELTVDEWERAKQEKAKQDNRVPPELLASILSQCNDLACDLCPEGTEETQASEEDAWRNDRRSGLEGVPGLNILLDSFLPPLTLQPRVFFQQSLVAKRMANSVKLTKNLSLTRSSPMSHYLSAKGSTAWEISVKERKEIVEDDVPVGWRIVEKANTPSTADGTKDKKSGGGLFSFWGRRQSQVPSASNVGANDSRPSSMDKPTSPVMGEVKSNRPSQDSVRSSATGNANQLPSPLSETTSSQPTPPLITPSTMSSHATAADTVSERVDTPPAPSAVSRFLNRFSVRSSVGGSPRNLALSSDDIEFLSDIVPSAADDADEDISADALENFVNTKRDSAVPVLPQPLAFPPKAPTIRSAHDASVSANARSTVASPANELEALFGYGTAATGSSVPLGTGGDRFSAPPLVTPLEPSSATESGPSRPTHVLSSAPLSSSRPPSRPQTSTPPIAGFALPPPPSFKPIMPIKPIKPSKPKLASPFPLLPLQVSNVEPGSMSASSTSSTSYETAAETPPPSPTSSLPLSELYPHLVTQSTPPQPSAQALFTDGKVNGFPTVSPAVETPLASAFSASPAPPPLRPPVQTRGAISPSGAPLKSNLFDDDDFSDFQSPADHHPHPLPPFVPSPIAKSPRTLAAAKAANAALRTLPSRSQTIPTLSPFAIPPAPSSLTPNRPSSTALQGNLNSLDDDDFTDFQTPPIISSLQTSSSSALFTNSASDKALLTPKNSMSFFENADFLSGSLATPSPPRVPAKPVPLLQPPAPSQSPPAPLLPPPSQTPSASTSAPSIPPASSSSSLLSRRESKKRSHAAEHLHTLSLVEKAAAKSGQQWPAPPSPLPAAIPGPSGGGPAKTSGSLFDIMDDEPEAPVGAPLAPSFSSPAMLNPVRPSSGMGMGMGRWNGSQSRGSMGLMPTSSNGSLSSSLLQGWDSSSFGSFQRTNTPPVASTPSFTGPIKPTNGNGNGGKGRGLSAQDLSFFNLYSCMILYLRVVLMARLFGFVSRS